MHTHTHSELIILNHTESTSANLPFCIELAESPSQSANRTHTVIEQYRELETHLNGSYEAIRASTVPTPFEHHLKIIRDKTKKALKLRCNFKLFDAKHSSAGCHPPGTRTGDWRIGESDSKFWVLSILRMRSNEKQASDF